MAKKKVLSLEEKLEKALIPKKDQPYELPKNWEWTKLGEIVSYKKGKKPKTFSEKGLPYLTIKALRNNLVEKYTEEEKKVLVETGDIGIVWDGAYSGLVGKFKQKGALGSTISRIDFNKNLILNNFIYKFYNFNFEKINSNTRGSGIPHTNPTYVNEMNFPLPPKFEQERIVNKIESMFEKINKAKKLISEARETFELRRASILHKAFTGELTKEWREKNPIKSKKLSIDNLLEKINAEKIDKWKEECVKAVEDGKRKPKKPVIKPVEEMKVEIEEQPYELPEGWGWVRLGEVCEDSKYGTSTKSTPTGKVPVLRMGNLQNGKLDWKKLVYTSDEIEINKYNLNKYDLLFNRTNSPELVGKTSIYLEEAKAIYAGYLIRIRTLDSLDPMMLNYYMNSNYIKQKCLEVKTDGVSQSNINAKKLGEFEVPLPPLAEQKEIVKKIEAMLESEEKAKELLDMEKQIELLEKSILSKAFRGELGTNDLNDEPAIELLRRVLGEK